MGNEPAKSGVPPGRYITSAQYGGEVLLNE